MSLAFIAFTHAVSTPLSLPAKVGAVAIRPMASTEAYVVARIIFLAKLVVTAWDPECKDSRRRGHLVNTGKSQSARTPPPDHSRLASGGDHVRNGERRALQFLPRGQHVGTQPQVL